VWDLCRRGLGVARPGDRPSAGEWLDVLEPILDELEADDVSAALAASFGPRPAPAALSGAAGANRRAVAGPGAAATPGDRSAEDRPGEVTVRAVAAVSRAASWAVVRLPPQAVTDTQSGFRVVGPRPGAPPGPAGAAGPSAGVARPGPSPVRAALRRALRWWAGLHRGTATDLRRRTTRRRALRRVALCALVDVIVAAWFLFLGAMLVSPFLGI